MGNREEALELLNRAKNLGSANDKESYLQLLLDANAVDPYVSNTYLQLGLYYYNEQNWNRALKHLLQYVHMDYNLEHDEKRAQNAYLHLAKCLKQMGMKSGAIKYVRDFIGLFPDAKISSTLVEQIYRDFPDRKEWFNTLKQTSQSYKDHDYEEALTHSEVCIAFYGDFPWSYYYRGLSLMKLCRNKEAITHFERAVELDDDFLFHFYLATAQKSLDRIDCAIDSLKKVIRISPLYAPALFLLGELLLEKKDVESARKFFNQVVEIDPESTIAGTSMKMLHSLEYKPVPKAIPVEEERDITDINAGEQLLLHRIEEEVRAKILKATQEAEEHLNKIRENMEREKSQILAEARKTADEEKQKILIDAREEKDRILSEVRNLVETQKQLIIQNAREERERIFEYTVKQAELEKQKIIEAAPQEKLRILEEMKRITLQPAISGEALSPITTAESSSPDIFTAVAKTTPEAPAAPHSSPPFEIKEHAGLKDTATGKISLETIEGDLFDEQCAALGRRAGQTECIEDEDSIEALLDEDIFDEEDDDDIKENLIQSEEIIHEKIDEILAQTGGVPESYGELIEKESEIYSPEEETIKKIEQEVVSEEPAEDDIIINGDLDAFLALIHF